MKRMSSLSFLLSLSVLSIATCALAESGGSGSCAGGKGCGTGILISPGRLTPSTAVYPAFGIPQPIGGGIFSVAAGGCTLNMWKAPSGYYYPYCGMPTGWPGSNLVMPIILSQQYNPPAAAEPPVSTFIEDTTEFLDKKKKDKKISDRDYQNMSQRLKDLGSKERYLRNQGGGTLDEHDAGQLRQDVEQVLREMQWRLGRNEKY